MAERAGGRQGLEAWGLRGELMPRGVRCRSVAARTGAADFALFQASTGRIGEKGLVRVACGSVIELRRRLCRLRPARGR